MRPGSILVCLAVGGCGVAPADTDLESAFCNLLDDGRERDVQATALPEGAPEVAFDEVNVEIALPGAGGEFAGFVTFTPDEPGFFAIGLGEDVPFEVQGPSGEALPWAAEVEGAACEELAVRYTVELELRSYTLSFGLTVFDEIEFVSEESNDDLGAL